jgi:hypothetical protein
MTIGNCCTKLQTLDLSYLPISEESLLTGSSIVFVSSHFKMRDPTNYSLCYRIVSL